MSDWRKENVMPIAFAVQRELAYRRKVAQLQSVSLADFCKDLLPLEGQSLSPIANRSPSFSLSGIKRQAPIINFESSPPPLLHQPEKVIDHLFCRLCQVPCSGSFNYKQHIRGRRHKIKEQEMKFGYGDLGDKQEAINQRRWCELCKIWCMDDAALNAHIGGQKHRDQLAKWESAEKSGLAIVKLESHCDMCNISCSGEDSLNMHYSGKRHKAELRKLQTAGKGIGKIVAQQHWCHLCNIWCVNEDSLRMHLKGKRHIVQIHKSEQKKAQIEIGCNCPKKQNGMGTEMWQQCSLSSTDDYQSVWNLGSHL